MCCLFGIGLYCTRSIHHGIIGKHNFFEHRANSSFSIRSYIASPPIREQRDAVRGHASGLYILITACYHDCACLLRKPQLDAMTIITPFNHRIQCCIAFCITCSVRVLTLSLVAPSRDDRRRYDRHNPLPYMSRDVRSLVV